MFSNRKRAEFLRNTYERHTLRVCIIIITDHRNRNYIAAVCVVYVFFFIYVLSENGSARARRTDLH